jgi:Ran GTPase-activating protein (RanGAP) involved in mRNA processing and transport
MQTFALCETLYESNIVSLDLSFNFLNDMAAQAIARLIKFSKSLQLLDLSGNEITSMGAKHIAEALMSSPDSSLRSLKLRGNSSIGDDGAISLAQCLQSNTSLTSLDLYDCGLGIKGIISICHALSESQSSALTSLDLGRPLLSSPQDTTSLSIAQMLASDNCIITHLGLAKHNIVDSNFETLVKYGLLKNSAKSQGLTSLDLSANKLGPFSGPMLELMLNDGGKHLSTLNLSHNNLGDGGALSIARCLPYASTLTNLDLRSNNIAESGLVSLAEALPLSSHLCSLLLWGNTFAPNASKAFLDSISAVGEGLLVDIKPYQADDRAQVAHAEVQTSVY